VSRFFFDADQNRHTWLDVEHVFVRLAVGRHFLLFAAAVQVQHIQLVKGVEQMPAHASEGGVVQVAVVGDEAQHSFAILLD